MKPAPAKKTIPATRPDFRTPAQLTASAPIRRTRSLLRRLTAYSSRNKKSLF